MSDSGCPEPLEVRLAVHEAMDVSSVTQGSCPGRKTQRSYSSIKVPTEGQFLI